MIVTSLPISYKDNRPFRILAGAFITSILSKTTGARAFYPINLVSLRGDNDDSASLRVESYKKTLENLGFLRDIDVVIPDTDDDLVHYSRALIHESVARNVCEFRQETISICQCGKVEMLSSLIDTLHENDQLQLVVKKGDAYFCKICLSALQEVEQEVLLHHQTYVSFPEIYPDTFAKTLNDKVKNLRDKSFLVSRLRVGKKFQISITPNLCLDPDFHAAIYLRYLSDTYGTSKIALVVSASHLFRGVRAIATANSLGPPLDISLIVHPMYDFSRNNSVFSDDMSPTDFLKITNGPTALKLFLCTLLQWRRFNSLCSSDDLALVQKSVRKLNAYHGPATVVPFEQAIPLLLNRMNYLKVLKKIRDGEPLLSEEMILVRSIM